MIGRAAAKLAATSSHAGASTEEGDVRKAIACLRTVPGELNTEAPAALEPHALALHNAFVQQTGLV